MALLEAELDGSSARVLAAANMRRETDNTFRTNTRREMEAVREERVSNVDRMQSIVLLSCPLLTAFYCPISGKDGTGGVRARDCRGQTPLRCGQGIYH